MQATPSDRWYRSSYSGPDGGVLVRELSSGTVQIGDSKHPDEPVLTFERHDWEAFVAGVNTGEF